MDYEIISNLTITFAAPQVQACINVTIKDNNISEYKKIFYIMMTTKDPAVIVEDDRKNLTFTILNDDKGKVVQRSSVQSIHDRAIKPRKVFANL